MRHSSKPTANLLILLSFLVSLRPLPLFSASDRVIPSDTVIASYDAADKVAACLKAETCLGPGKATTWADFLANKPPCLSVYKVWWSPREPSMPAVLITQLSADRVQQLSAQCATWRGPLAAALYIALPREDSGQDDLSSSARYHLTQAMVRINTVFHAAEASGHCQLRVMLVYELLAEPRAISLYPVNSLRNYARLMADTEIIANIDVDMVPSLTLSVSLMDETIARDYLKGCRAGHVYVLPAFDVKCGGPSYADAACVKDKQGLMQLVKADCVSSFREIVAPSSHNVTNFARWATEAQPYRIQYQELFEPWFLSARHRTPWFDARFRGYGKNKIVQAMHMNWTGTTFMVHSTAFIVHRPHNESRARKEFMRAKFHRNTATPNGTIFEHIADLYATTKVELAAATYTTVADPGMQQCLESLPWWKGVQVRLGSEPT